MRNKLYKYCSIERAHQILTDRTLYFSSINQLNDVFEMYFDMSGLFETRLEQTIEETYHKQVAEGFIGNFTQWKAEMTSQKFIYSMRNNSLSSERKVKNNQFSQIGILCLSQRDDSPLMFAHYSSSGQGVCLGFKRDSSVLKDSRCGGISGPNKVVYQSTVKPLTGQTPRQKLKEIVTHKYSGWEYEEEVRYLRALKSPFAGESIPFEISDLVEIICGPTMSLKNAFAMLAIR